MNKKELLAELATKFHKVYGEEQLEKDSRANLTIIKVLVLDVVNDTMIRKSIPAYIENAGLPNEQAFYAETKPESRVEVADKIAEAAVVSAEAVKSIAE